MNSNDTILVPGQSIRPCVKENVPALLVERLYGMRVKSIKELNGYDDRNYHVICEESSSNAEDRHAPASDGYVLKIVNSLDSKKVDVIDAQTEILLFLNKKGVVCPLPVKNLKGDYYSLEKLNVEDEKVQSESLKHAVRLLVYRPGNLLHSVTLSKELLWSVGHFTANLDSILLDFSHPAYDTHETIWMLHSVPKLREFVYAVGNSIDRQLVLDVIQAFESEVLRNAENLERGIIHGDLNEQNFVMSPDGKEIAAVIDLTDVQKTYLVFELAIALCYMILQGGDVKMGKHVVQGYETIRKLTEEEKKILKVSVCARMCQSLVLGAYTHLHDPKNTYILVTQKSGWALLKRLWPMMQDEISDAWGLHL